MVRSAVGLHTHLKAEEKKFLLIEDNPDHIFLVRKCIGDSLKSQVEAVETGEAGVEKLKNEKFDLVITDFNLPGMNGLEVLEVIKKMDINTPIIMLTGQGDEKVAVTAMRGGAYNYVVKDDVCYTILPRVISETLTRYYADKEKERFEREIREKSEALEKANKELKQLDELKSQFISSVTHEFRNPLNSIKESIELIIDKIVDPTTDQGKRVLEIAKNSTDRLTILVNDLLDFSKLEAGKMKMNKVPTEIKSVIEEAVESLQSFAQKKKINLECQFLDEKVVVFVDPLRIVQVIINLVNNAIKFTPQNGHITVSYDLFKDEKEQHHKVRLIVQDNGEGVPKENLKKIFERFEQLKVPQKAEIAQLQGTGLGLSICREIVGQHQGRIWAESDGEQGSKFIFTLPKYR